MTLTIPQLNEWYGRTCVFHPWALRVEEAGIAIAKGVYEETLTICPLRCKDIVVKVLEFAGVRAVPSKAGRITERLISQMGGLEGCRVFKIRGVRDLIESSQARKGITWGEATLKIYDHGQFDHYKGLVIERREKPDLTTSDVFRYLLKKGLFLPGLLVECPNCTLECWIPITSLGRLCTCDFCDFRFPIAPHLKHRGDWRFRLTGLFGRDDHQEGAIPVALTLLQLLRRHRGGWAFTYSTGLELRGTDLDCECDLLVLDRERDGTPVVLLGECKTSNVIADDQIEKLLKVRHLVLAAGLQCHLLFAKTDQEFAPTEISRFEELHAAGVPLILFTARELEPYEPYLLAPDKEGLPHPYGTTFSEMAENSAYRYLRGGRSADGRQEQDDRRPGRDSSNMSG